MATLHYGSRREAVAAKLRTEEEARKAAEARRDAKRIEALADHLDLLRLQASLTSVGTTTSSSATTADVLRSRIRSPLAQPVPLGDPHGADRLPYSAAPLHKVVCEGNVDMLDFLVSRCHADFNTVDSDGSSPVMLAIAHGHVPVLAYLLKKMARVDGANDRGYTALHLAVLDGQAPMLDLVLQYRGAMQLDARDEEGLTALHWAVLLGRESVTEDLLVAGASHTIGDRIAWRPLHHAAMKGEMGLVRTLVTKHGADPTATDRDGRTALHRAVGCGQYAVLRPLLLNSVDKQDKDGNTALHLAARDGSTKIARFLLNNGARADLKNKAGQLPVHLAAETTTASLMRQLSEGKNAQLLQVKNAQGLRAADIAAHDAAMVACVKSILEPEVAPREPNLEQVMDETIPRKKATGTPSKKPALPKVPDAAPAAAPAAKPYTFQQSPRPWRNPGKPAVAEK